MTLSPQFAVAARTDRGVRREVNEDALFAADPCFLVADGMGGHENGAAASKAAISAFSERFTAPSEASLAAVEEALDEARERVRAVSAETDRGAGCTLTGAIRVEHEDKPYWYVLNIGDSRVYLLRGNRLLQLTSDHSLREERLAEGDQAAATTPRNIITRALGSDDDRHDAWLLPIENGTRMLICSDGLTNEIADEQLQSLLIAGGRTESVVDELLRRAIDEGGRDNISIVLVDIISGGVEVQPLDDFDETSGTTLEITRPKSRLA